MGSLLQTLTLTAHTSTYVFTHAARAFCMCEHSMSTVTHLVQAGDVSNDSHKLIGHRAVCVIGS